MKIVLRGYFGHQNLGDDLLLLEALNKIPKGYELQVVADGLDCKDNLAEFQQERNFEIVTSKRSALQLSDYQMFFGGGQFPTTQTSIKSFLGLMAARMTSRKLIVNGCGIVPKPHDKLFPIWLKILSYCSVRDDVSANYAGKYRQVINCGDLYWGNENHYTNERRGNKCLICLANPFSEEEKRSVHFAARYERFLSDCCSIIAAIKKRGYETTYLPFFVHSDTMLFSDLQQRLGTSDKVLLRRKDYDIGEIDKLFSEYDLGICMRFHSILLALKNTLPMVAICYDYKSKSMLEEAGLSDYAVDYGIRPTNFFGMEFDLDKERMLQILNKSINTTNGYQQLAHAFYDRKHGQVLNNYDKIFTLIQTKT